MIHTPLDPNEAVVLFADLQAGIIERAGTNAIPRLKRTVHALAKLASLFSIPVVVTAAPVSDGAPLITPEIGAALGDLPVHIRATTDAFTHASSREAIEKTGRRILLVTGVATEIIVQHSALSAAACGFSVQVVVDACGGLSERTEAAAFQRLAQAGVIMTSVASIAGQLAGDFTQSRGAMALGVLYEMASSGP